MVKVRGSLLAHTEETVVRRLVTRRPNRRKWNAGDLDHRIGAPRRSAAAVEADHVLYGWFFFTLVIIILIAIGMAFAQKIDRRIPIRASGWSKPAAWRFAIGIPPALLLSVAGPAYAAPLNALYPSAPLPRA